jgi:hypothetical protein
VPLGNPPSSNAPPILPTFQDPASSSASQAAGLRDAWEKILEEHLIARKPSKQVFIGAGLPVLPKRLVDKTIAGEYINFNELIPFCDPGAEEEPTSTSTPEHYLFPGLGVIRPGHKIAYSFLQWASCFVTYMAALSSNRQNVTHMCTYFNVILKASREYTDDMWKHYDVTYRQKAEATRNTDWSVIDTATFNQCFTGRAKKALSCTYCNSIKHDTESCPRKKNKRSPTIVDEAGPAPKQAKTKSDRPCHHSPCIYKHQCLKCSEDHAFLDCPKRGKREPAKNNPTTTRIDNTISHYHNQNSQFNHNIIKT